MKKIVFLLASAVLTAGCATDILEESDVATTRADAGKAMPEIRERSLEGAVYNEVTDAWMIPQPDPYALENFQAAYDKLAAGKSVQTLTKAQAAEFSVGKRLAPTHYALKIYPKSEEEQWRVERMEDVQVAYSPFCYARPTKKEIEKLTLTKSKARIFAEKSPYTVTYENIEATDGGPTDPVTFQLPILYTVWPVSKPLPTDLEYVVDYEVFLPEITPGTSPNEEENAVYLLLNEARANVYGTSPTKSASLTRSGYNGPLWCLVSGTIKTWDNSLNQNVPMSNLRLRQTEGSLIKEWNTDANGYFSFDAATTGPGFWYPMSLYAIYQDQQGRWKITTENSYEPIEAHIADFDVYHRPTPLPFGEILIEHDINQSQIIHRAVNYFINSQTDIPVYSPSEGITIVASTRSSLAAGSFSYSGWNNVDPVTGEAYNFNYSSYITIYNNGNNNGRVLGTTLHELGHHTHFWNDIIQFRPQYTFMMFLKESFASYAGWYMALGHYESLGWIHPGGDPPLISGNTRQSWTRNTNSFSGTANLGWYSPVFVDMTDTHNQGANNSGYPNDKIQGISPSDIWNIVTTSKEWNTGPLQQQCRPKIVNLVGSSPDFGDWIDDFDAWVGWE